jgi:2-aminoadipate transaminase
MKSPALSELARRTEAPAIAWLMGQALARPKLISLAAGFTDNESLPVETTRELLDEILGSTRTGQAALQYGSSAGDPALRELTARHLRKCDRHSGAEKNYSPDRLIISNGSQQLLYMTTEALCDAGDIVLVEDPTYFVYLSLLKSHGARARAIRMDRDGLDLAHLEEVLKSLKRTGELRRVKLLYLVSYYQNPTTITTSFEKKAGILKLMRQFERAAGHPIYLLEDAAYRELRFHGRDEKSALANGESERVIYLGTYSKPFATGTRVGYGIFPGALFETVLRIKGNHDFGTSNLLQQLLSRVLSSGRYEKHLAKIQKRYAHKASVMSRALREHFPPEVRRDEPEGGLYFWARLPRGMNAGMKSGLFESALKNDVLYVPGEICYADDVSRKKPNHEMRISFGNATEKDIRIGVARLGKAICDLD